MYTYMKCWYIYTCIRMYIYIYIYVLNILNTYMVNICIYRWGVYICQFAKTNSFVVHTYGTASVPTLLSRPLAWFVRSPERVVRSRAFRRGSRRGRRRVGREEGQSGWGHTFFLDKSRYISIIYTNNIYQ